MSTPTPKIWTLITGASSGIGMELARVAAREGHNLVLVARRGDRLQALQQELATEDLTVETVSLDLAQANAAADLVSILGERGIVVDRLINNAGFGSMGRFHEQPLDRTQSMIQLNVTTLVDLTRLLLPGMIERGSGRILQVASTAGFVPGPLQAIYFSTKAFVVSFSQAIDHELRGTGVTCTALCPGPVKTEFFKVAGVETSATAQRGAPAEKVARVGWEGMERGRLVVSENRGLMFLLRFVGPFMTRRMQLAAIMRSQQPR